MPGSPFSPCGRRWPSEARSDERLSVVSSCISELISRVACFCVEDDEEFSGERDADDHFGFAGLLQPVVEGLEMRVVAGGEAGDEEEDGARAGAAAAHRAVA